MRSRVWSCSSCIVLLVSALLGREATASHVARQKKDLIHRVAKAQVTPHVARRDDSTCQADYSLCPASLSGGCCPNAYECETDSCYATTAGTTSACGKAGWFWCPASDSGGCCPNGYVCGRLDCTAPAGVTNTYTSCPTNYYLCPASYNFGCCMSGMGCAINACYSTAPVTSTVVQTITTTSGGSAITTTQTAVTIATPTAPAGLPTTDPNVAPKFIPSSVPKISATTTPSNNSGGLTTPELAGIISAVVILIIFVALMVYFLRRLNRVAKAMESSKKGSSSGPRTKSQSQAEMAHYGGQLHISPSDMDNMSIDPLMVTPNTNNTSSVGTPQPGAVAVAGRRGRSDSDNFSPLGGSSGDHHLRQASLDSSGPGYFDLPPRVHNMPGSRPAPMSAAVIRSSTDSRSTQGGQFSQYAYQQHWRSQSNSSELSAGSSEGGGVGSPLIVPELDASGAFVELPGSSDDRIGDGNGSRSRASSVAQASSYAVPTATASPRTSFGHARRRSDSNTTTGRNNEGSPPPPATAGVFSPLDVVNESSEVIHGYYGPRDRQAGQTAAGLAVEWDLSSPTVPGFQQQGSPPPHPHPPPS
ncbi:hypothetical protein QBC46DRAFT_6014 [Diplogelasinospora grovesii]|uniref:Uncharacterized protein n=1 Tax=Diplogelasinospora grovesii TaxID=303347 RepID=A0AAN6SAG2_9PEZI|nr:hypothetical protein QBC46DRAFT_6014 [Diplogelasinospora grovesii]